MTLTDSSLRTSPTSMPLSPIKPFPFTSFHFRCFDFHSHLFSKQLLFTLIFVPCQFLKGKVRSIFYWLGTLIPNTNQTPSPGIPPTPLYPGCFFGALVITYVSVTPFDYWINNYSSFSFMLVFVCLCLCFSPCIFHCICLFYLYYDFHDIFSHKRSSCSSRCASPLQRRKKPKLSG